MFSPSVKRLRICVIYFFGKRYEKICIVLRVNLHYISTVKKVEFNTVHVQSFRSCTEKFFFIQYKTNKLYFIQKIDFSFLLGMFLLPMTFLFLKSEKLTISLFIKIQKIYSYTSIWLDNITLKNVEKLGEFPL